MKMRLSYGSRKRRPRDYSEPDEEMKLRTAIDRAYENIELTRRRMRNDQIEIDRLREETRALIAELMP